MQQRLNVRVDVISGLLSFWVAELDFITACPLGACLAQYEIYNCKPNTVIDSSRWGWINGELWGGKLWESYSKTKVASYSKTKVASYGKTKVAS